MSEETVSIIDIFQDKERFLEHLQQKKEQSRHRRVERQGLKRSQIAEFDVPDFIYDISFDYETLEMMDYRSIALLEVIMLIGRELYISKLHNSSFTSEYRGIDLDDFNRWADIFNIPLTEEEGGDRYQAMEYILGKPVDDYVWEYLRKINFDALPA